MSYLLSPALAWSLAQIFKLTRESIRHRRLRLKTLTETGGMPSSHSALVMALTTDIGRQQGVKSAIFAVALIFSLVVMYDAQGVRRAAGRQAEVINQLLEEFFEHLKLREERLRELIGHTPIEVLVGALLGVLIGLLPL